MKSTEKLNPIYPDLKKLKSEVEKTSQLPAPQEVWDWLENGKVILWTHAGICVGTVKGKEITWVQGKDLAELAWSEYLVELRAFNEHKEWRLWRQGGTIVGRQRTDCEGGKDKALDTRMKLRGVVATALPSSGETLVLHTRNYLWENAVGMTGYVDVRFLEIDDKIKGGVK